MAANLALLAFVVIVVFEVITAIPKIISEYVICLCSTGRKGVDGLKQQLQQLQSAQDEINMQDEFAKHAKLQRRINAVNAKLKTYVSDYRNSARKIHWSLVAFFYGLYAIFSIYLLVNYRGVIAVSLPDNWFAPIDVLLSYPSQEKGGISFLVWFLMVRHVTKRVISHVRAKALSTADAT